MKAMIYLRRNADGVIRCVSHEWNGDFVWVDGNYACDCNRALFFATAGGEPDPDQSCGDSAYTALWARLENGEKIRLDGDEVKPR